MGERYLEEINFELARAIGRPRTVLDIGCGRGQNGELATQKGAKVVGIESWPPSVEAARTRMSEVIDADVLEQRLRDDPDKLNDVKQRCHY